jgi:hypothetical protein
VLSSRLKEDHIFVKILGLAPAAFGVMKGKPDGEMGEVGVFSFGDHSEEDITPV